jgi:hypothetical protein
MARRTLAAIYRAAIQPLASLVRDRDGLWETTVAGVNHRHPLTSALLAIY